MWQATTRPSVACAFGAYLVDGGTRLRCHLLLVNKGTTHKAVTLKNLETKERIRVRLPEKAIGQKGIARFSKEVLEVL